MMIRVPFNTTAIDVSFNLSGSLTGFPAVIYQLPVGKRIGFDTLPDVGSDVEDIGQTWTPDIQDKVLDINVTTYNVLGKEKAPYTTDLTGLEAVITWGQNTIKELIP